MHGSAAPVTGTPLTRRQIREADRAREAARVAAAETAPVTEQDGSDADEAVAEPQPAATQQAAPALTERDATPTVTMRRLPVTRRDLRPVDVAPAKRRGRPVAPRMAVLGVLGVLTIAVPVAGLPAHDDTANAAAVSSVSAQASVLDVLDAGVAAAALTAPAPTTLLASPTAAGRAEVAAASRASERSALPAETLAGASGAVAAVVEPAPEPEPEPEPEPVATPEPAPAPAPPPAPAVVMPMDAGTYRNTSGYGYRSFPFAGMHTGTDLAAPLDTPIRSVADGVVTYVGPGKAGRSSMLITVEHEIDGQWVETWYNHMFANDIYVQLGQTVKAGEVIAGVGNNGRSTGPHLHFEVHLDKNLTTVEPLAWLAARGAVSAG